MQTENWQDGHRHTLDKVDEGRRAALRTIAAATAFVVPMVASFSTDGLRFNIAEAGNHGGNQTNGGKKDHFFRKWLKFFKKWFKHHNKKKNWP
jgi:hypothetical protein